MMPALRGALTWRTVLSLLVALGITVMIARLATGREVDTLLSFHLGPLVLATALVILAIVGWALCWSLILTRIDRSVSLSRCVRTFAYTWLVRYLPGTVPYHVARVLAADSLGTSKVKVGASIAYETVLLLASGALIGCIGVLLGNGAEGSWLIYLAVVGSVAALPLVLRPQVLAPITNVMLRLARRSPIDAGSLLATRQAAAIFTLYTLVHVINGLAFVLVLNALNSGPVNPAFAVGVYTLAGVIGALVIFVPSGLGVREAVIVGLMSSAISPEEALLAAGAVRAVSIAADLLLLSVLGLLELGWRAQRAALVRAP
jgi:uncharacterized membrane protein YbhN (UPF0104 family)